MLADVSGTKCEHPYQIEFSDINLLCYSMNERKRENHNDTVNKTHRKFGLLYHDHRRFGLSLSLASLVLLEVRRASG